MIFFFFLSKQFGGLQVYEDDNTVSYAPDNLLFLKDVLTIDSFILIEWIFDNHMQANPDKFQALALGLKSLNECPSFNLGIK